MNYRDKVFLSVAKNLSFTKASEELFISQPAVTKHIKELESNLNISLFERKGNRILLTKAGEKAYDYLIKIEQQYRDLEFDLGRLSDTFKGELKIGASSTIAQYVVPKAMAAFHKRYPEIKLYLFNGNSFEIEQLLVKNEIDFALVENVSSHSDIKYIDFIDDEIVAVAGVNSLYAKRKHITINDFLEIPLVLREKGSGTLQTIYKEFQKNIEHIDELNTFIYLGSTEAIKDFITNFDGLALISEKAIQKELARKELVRIHIKGIQITRKFRMALRQGQETKATHLFIDHLTQYIF